MLVTIDESGDPGFKAGSTAAFVLAMVTFRSFDAAEACAREIRALQRERRVFPEFKFAKCRDELREAFLRRVRTHDFCVRAIVVRKERVHSPHLRRDDGTFYDFFLRLMMQHDGGLLRDAVVKIDASGDIDFKQRLVAYLRKRLRRGQVRKLRLCDSCSDHLVQLADMCAGAIARSVRADTKADGRWRALLARRIEDVWDFR